MPLLSKPVKESGCPTLVVLVCFCFVFLQVYLYLLELVVFVGFGFLTLYYCCTCLVHVGSYYATRDNFGKQPHRTANSTRDLIYFDL